MASRTIVVPGDVLDDSGNKDAGQNTYKEGKNVYALRLGLKRERRGTIEVVAISGKRYDPQRGDLIIGTVADLRPTNWYLEVNAPSQVGMHVNEVPWRVDFGETAEYLNIGDTVLLKVYHVDELKNAQVTMKDRACRKLEGGVTIQVQPSKVPRIIGRAGSMIETLKERTRCRIFVGKNGIIWLDGEPEDVSKAVAAIRLIEAEAHTSGLTDRVADFLGAPRTGASDDDDDWDEGDYVDDDVDGSDGDASEEEDDDSDDDGPASSDVSEDDEDDDSDDDSDDRRGRDRGRSGGAKRRRRGRRGGRNRRS